VLVSTTGASPSSRNRATQVSFAAAIRPSRKKGPHREGAGPPLLWSSPCDARQGAASVASGKELPRHLPRSVGKRASCARSTPGRGGSGWRVVGSGRGYTTPGFGWVLEGAPRAEVLGRTGERGLASG
jgi:hypothetical protein